MGTDPVSRDTLTLTLTHHYGHIHVQLTLPTFNNVMQHFMSVDSGTGNPTIPRWVSDTFLTLNQEDRAHVNTLASVVDMQVEN